MKRPMMRQLTMVLMLLVASMTMAAKTPKQKPLTNYRQFAAEVWAVQDSLEEVMNIDPEKLDLQSTEERLMATADPVKQAVWHHLLSEVYQALSYANVHYRDADAKSRYQELQQQHKSAVLVNMEALLKVPAAEMDTLYQKAEHVVSGDVSTDLLMVLLNKIGSDDDFAKAEALYAAAGKKREQLILTCRRAVRDYDMMWSKSPRERYDYLTMWIDSLREAPNVVLLQMQYDALIKPVANVWAEGVILPNEDQRVGISLKNLPKADLFVLRGKDTIYSQTILAPERANRLPIDVDTVYVPLRLPVGQYMVGVGVGAGDAYKTELRVTSLSLLNYVAGKYHALIPLDIFTGKEVKADIKKNNAYHVKAVRGKDDETDWMYYSTGNNRSSDAAATTYTGEILTDRVMYRPGQTIHAYALFWYMRESNEETGVLTNKTLTFTLRDRNGKVVDTRQVKLNAFGSASVDFQLPADAEVGEYSIEAIVPRSTKISSSLCEAWKQVEVTEYKRPTFEVLLDEYKETLRIGDSARMTGKAKMMTGVALQQGEVHYEVRLQSYHYWWQRRNGGGVLLKEGDAELQADGQFEMPFTLDSAACSGNDSPFLCVALTARVTAANGETHEQTAYTYISKKDYSLGIGKIGEADIKNGAAVVVKATNAMGKEVAMNGRIQLLRGKQLLREWPVHSSDTIAVPDTLSAGTYTWRAMSDVDTTELTLSYYHSEHLSAKTYFTEDYVAFGNKEWSTDGVDIYVAPEMEDVYLWIFVSGDKSGTRVLHDEIKSGIKRVHIADAGKGDKAVRVEVIYLRRGHKMIKLCSYELPIPEKKLQIGFTTFRDRTTPGSKEEWTLSVTDKQDKPVKAAELTAAMYDASLDRLGIRNTWNLELGYYRPYIYSSTHMYSPNSLTLRRYVENRNTYPQWSLPMWDSFAFNSRRTFYGAVSGVKVRGAASAGLYGARSMKEADLIEEEVVVTGMAVMNEDAVAMDRIAPMANVLAAGVEMEGTVNFDQYLRTNLSELALWMPQVQTGKQGEAVLSFTMPDALTEWRLLLLAHTADMHYAVADTTVRVQKAVMATPMWPRFMREGDSIMLSAMVQNQSAEALSLRSRWEVRMADSTLLATGEAALQLAADGMVNTTYALHPDSTWGDSVRLSFVAGNQQVGDGEAVWVPVLHPEKEKPATIVVDKDPLDLLREAVKEVKMPRLDNALDCALAIYLGRQLGKSTAVAESKLRLMQKADGGWSWCPGMESSAYMTLSVVRMLEKVPGVMTREIGKALAFLDKEEMKHYRWMQQHEKTISFPSEHTCQYLLASAAVGRTLTDSVREMQQAYLSLMEKKALLLTTNREARRTPYTIYGAAQVSDMFGRTGKTKAADACRYHLLHYSVYREGFGRYYATDAAEYSWMDYKLPTQLAAIHALQGAKDYDNEVAEMMLWVLRQKQTQQWQNPINILEVNELVKNTQSSAVGQKWQMLLVASKDTYMQDALSISSRVMGDSALHVGEKRTLRVSLYADRDMDFLKVTLPLAGCMELKNQHSGYRFLGSMWGYVAVHDEQVDIYISHFRTGTATLDLDFYVVREGLYQLPAAEVVSTYNPAFAAKAEALKLVVEK